MPRGRPKDSEKETEVPVNIPKITKKNFLEKLTKKQIFF